MRKVPGALIWESGTGQRNRRMGGGRLQLRRDGGWRGRGPEGGRADYAQGTDWVKAQGRRELWLELRSQRQGRDPRGG